MQTQKEITVGQIWEEVDPRLIRKVGDAANLLI